MYLHAAAETAKIGRQFRVNRLAGGKLKLPSVKPRFNEISRV